MLKAILDHFKYEILRKDGSTGKLEISGFLYKNVLPDRFWLNLQAQIRKSTDDLPEDIAFKLFKNEKATLNKISDEFESLVEKLPIFDSEKEKEKDKNARKRQKIEYKKQMGTEKFENMTLYRDPGTGDFFVSEIKDGIEVCSYMEGDSYMDFCGFSKAEATQSSIFAKKEYVPKEAPGFLDNRMHEGFKIFNTYVAPAWYGMNIKPRNNPPPLFKKLIDHLFPYKPDRDYFLQWTAESLFGRCPTILILRSKPGVGKTTLKNLLYALHGKKNSTSGKQSTLEGRFNSQVEDCTLLWFDEGQIRKGMENFLKTLPDDAVSIERKGMDTTRSTKLHANVVFSNNEFTDNSVDYEDRKFVPLYLSNIKLEKVFSDDDFKSYNKKVDLDNPDKQFLAEIVGYLKTIVIPSKSKMEYKGPAFWRMCYETSSQWQKTVLDLLTNKDLREKIYVEQKKAFKWSLIYETYQKRYAQKEKIDFPRNTNKAMKFFDSFRDCTGRKCFEPLRIYGEKGAMAGDLYIKQIREQIIICDEMEAIKIMQQRGEKNGSKQSSGPKGVGKKNDETTSKVGKASNVKSKVGRRSDGDLV